MKSNELNLEEVYKQLTPENKRKFRAYYFELLAQELNDAAKHLYYFDCLDGLLSEKLFTPSEIKKVLTGKAEPMTETEIIRIAKNYEATLYRYEKDKDGNPINEVIIYDPFDM